MEDDKPMMAAEPAVAYATPTYYDVMGYLHRIRLTPAVKESVARRLMAEVTNPDLAKTFERLDHLSQLQSGWDGRGARKISYAVIDHLRDVLLISDNEDWKYWMISPAPNGSLSLQSKRHIALQRATQNDDRLLAEDAFADSEEPGADTSCPPRGVPRGAATCGVFAHRHRSFADAGSVTARRMGNRTLQRGCDEVTLIFPSDSQTPFPLGQTGTTGRKSRLSTKQT